MRVPIERSDMCNVSMVGAPPHLHALYRIAHHKLRQMWYNPTFLYFLWFVYA